MRDTKSVNSPYGPPLPRSAMIASTAPVPTFLMPRRPNRMRPPATLKSAAERLMDGGSTSSPSSRASLTYSASLSVSCISLVRLAAMNSAGKLAFRYAVR